MNKKQFKDLFISLTRTTVPHRYEHLMFDEMMLKHGAIKDGIGNYTITIGDSKTMFTSHLDTVGGLVQKKVTHLEFIDETTSELCICTDGTTILGADDKAGVALMLLMISAKIPGTYVFFVGEEVGAIGSSWFVENNTNEYLSKFNKVVSFDRRGYKSIITSQFGRQCCSNDFAKALSEELNSLNDTFGYKPDPTGIFTDSASFMSVIPECTNISVGYFSEHSVNECLNIDFLYQLALACCNVRWEMLPISRNPVEVKRRLSDLALEDLALEVNEILTELSGLSCNELYVYGNFKTDKSYSFVSTKGKSRESVLKMVIHSDGSIIFRRGKKKLSYKSSDEVFSGVILGEINKIVKR